MMPSKRAFSALVDCSEFMSSTVSACIALRCHTFTAPSLVSHNQEANVTKLDTNFGAPFHVVSRDASGMTGVVSSHTDQASADEAAGNLKAQLDATGNEKTDVYVVNGQADLAAFIEQEDGIPAAVQTDNSGAREAEQVEALTGNDAGDASDGKDDGGSKK